MYSTQGRDRALLFAIEHHGPGLPEHYLQLFTDADSLDFIGFSEGGCLYLHGLTIPNVIGNSGLLDPSPSLPMTR